MMRPLMKLFSGGDHTPSSALCAPKDCASVCTCGRNRQGPSSLFIHHPADQTLAHRSGSARRGSEHPAGDPGHRGLGLIASPGPSCPSPVPSLPAPSPAPAVARVPARPPTTPVRLLVLRPEPLWGRSPRFFLASRRRPPTRRSGGGRKGWGARAPRATRAGTLWERARASATVRAPQPPVTRCPTCGAPHPDPASWASPAGCSSPPAAFPRPR